jgi:hypothetical protein
VAFVDGVEPQTADEGNGTAAADGGEVESEPDDGVTPWPEE